MADRSPFFTSISVGEPHRPYRRRYIEPEVYDEYDADSVDPLPYLPDERGIREEIADLKSVITGATDRAVGQIVKAVEEHGLGEETVVIFTTDHGIAFPRAKGTCYDPGLETALIMRYDGGFPAGDTCDDLLSNVDFLPTLLDLVGADVPANLDGRSFLPALTAGEDASRDHVFAEMTWQDRYNPMRAVRTAHYKYIRNFSMVPRVLLTTDTFPSQAGRAVREEYYVTERPAEELYDLEADPHERENLAPTRAVYEGPENGHPPDPAHTDVLDELRGVVDEWMAASNDPLLNGPVGLPTREDPAPCPICDTGGKCN